MLRLTLRQRMLLVEKLPDAANVAIGALFFGQFLSQQPFSRAVAVFGVGVWGFFMGVAIFLARGDGR